MTENAGTTTPHVSAEEARQVFETMRIGTQEQRTRVLEQSRKANQVKAPRSYSLRLSYSSGSTTDEK
jgi:hypothetical protein